jgi:hypothetical protein
MQIGAEAMTELPAWQFDGWIIWQRHERRGEWWNMTLTRAIAENKSMRRRYALAWNGERFAISSEFRKFCTQIEMNEFEHLELFLREKLK